MVTDSEYTVCIVSVGGSYTDQRLEGFMLVAVPLNAQDETTAMGTFQVSQRFISSVKSMWDVHFDAISDIITKRKQKFLNNYQNSENLLCSVVCSTL